MITSAQPVLLEAWAKGREQVNEYLAAFASPAVALAVVGWLETAVKSSAPQK